MSGRKLQPIPPATEWPVHLHKRPGSKRFYARVRVPPSVGSPSSHVTKTLGTEDYREAVSRLPLVVAELKASIQAARRTPEGVLRGTSRETPASAARWWRERIVASGYNPRRGIPDALLPEWEAITEEMLGRVVDVDDFDVERGGTPSPIYEGEERVRQLRDQITGDAQPIGAELERFIAETEPSPRYAERHRRAVRRLRSWLQGQGAADDLQRLRRPEAGRFVDSLLAGGLTTATVNSLVSSLSTYWGWLGRRMGVEQNPWKDQQRKTKQGEARGRKRPPSDDEVVLLLSGPATTTLHDLMRVAALSGMRINEIAALRVGDVRDDAFHVEGTKTAAARRVVPIHPSLRRLVARRTEAKGPEARLFHELRAPASRAKELSAKASEAFTRYRRGLGIDPRLPGQRQSDVDFHSFRRWFITAAERAGHAGPTLSSVVGHARDGMTLGTYSAGPSVEQLRAVVEAVRLPAGAPVESPEGQAMGAGRWPGQAAAEVAAASGGRGLSS
jgi:integrase